MVMDEGSWGDIKFALSAIKAHRLGQDIRTSFRLVRRVSKSQMTQRSLSRTLITICRECHSSTITMICLDYAIRTSLSIRVQLRSLVVSVSLLETKDSLFKAQTKIDLGKRSEEPLRNVKPTRRENLSKYLQLLLYDQFS